eukprot:scaffold3521_cov195-Alexandrium_tamarense.AAC.28
MQAQTAVSCGFGRMEPLELQNTSSNKIIRGHSEPTHRLIRNTIIMSAAAESWSSDREDVEVGST